MWNPFSIRWVCYRTARKEFTDSHHYWRLLNVTKEKIWAQEANTSQFFSACLCCWKELQKSKPLVSAKILLILLQRWIQNQSNSSLRRYQKADCLDFRYCLASFVNKEQTILCVTLLRNWLCKLVVVSIENDWLQCILPFTLCPSFLAWFICNASVSTSRLRSPSSLLCIGVFLFQRKRYWVCACCSCVSSGNEAYLFALRRLSGCPN